jgi:hypothetical protein
MRQVWLPALIAAGCWLSRPSLAQQPAPSSECEDKAGFLLNFLKYVEWPSSTDSDTNAPLKICLIGEDRIGTSLSSLTKSKTINGRTVVLEHCDGGCASRRQCRLLFVSGSENRRLEEVLAAVKNLPMLTVGESDDFLERGGMISLVMRDKAVRLEINLAGAEAAGLKISSRLLAVANVVKRK